MTGLDKDKIIAMYEHGVLLKDIASEIGCAPSYVGVMLKKWGFERPSKPQKKWKYEGIDENKMASLWTDAGLCVTQIAERLSVTPAAVRRVLSSRGLLDPANPRHRYDGRAGNARRSGNAFARIAGRT